MKNARITYVKFNEAGEYVYTIRVENKRFKDPTALQDRILKEVTKLNQTGAMIEIESHVKGLYDETFYLNYNESFYNH